MIIRPYRPIAAQGATAPFHILIDTGAVFALTNRKAFDDVTQSAVANILACEFKENSSFGGASFQRGAQHRAGLVAGGMGFAIHHCHAASAVDVLTIAVLVHAHPSAAAIQGHIGLTVSDIQARLAWRQQVGNMAVIRTDFSFAGARALCHFRIQAKSVVPNRHAGIRKVFPHVVRGIAASRHASFLIAGHEAFRIASGGYAANIALAVVAAQLAENRRNAVVCVTVHGDFEVTLILEGVFVAWQREPRFIAAPIAA